MTFFLPPKQLQADVEAGKGLVSKLFLDSPPGWGANLLHLLHADALSSWREGSTPVHPITDTFTVEYLADKLPGLQKRAQEKQWQKDRQDRVKVYVGDALRRGTVPKDAEVLKTARQIIDGRVTKEQETLDPARVDRLARRAVSIEAFKAELEQAEGSEQDMKRLFLHAFDEAGTQEKITLLDKRGWLEKVVPEFARNRELTQDERWHGKEQVGEHLIAAIGYMDDLIDQNPPFANPRYEKLLRLSAFFHDMGKNEDPENAPSAKKKEGSGYRVVDQRPDEAFQRVRFLGHAGVGAGIAEKRLSHLVKDGVDSISESEIRLVSLWVRHHMKAVDATRDLERTDADELAERVVRDMYPIELLNDGTPLAEAMRAGMLVQKMELELAQDTPEKATWTKGWAQITEAIETKLPLLESQNKERLMAPLVEGGDLTEIGIPQKFRKGIRQEILTRQKNGEVTTRAGGLYLAVELAFSLAEEQGEPLEIKQDKIEGLLGRGALRNFSMRMENLRNYPAEEREGYTVYRYESQPIKEFTEKTTPADIEQRIFSGNFPNLAKHIRENAIPMDAVKELLVKRGFANLVQLEDFVKSHGAMGERITNIKHTFSPLTRTLEVKRTLPHGSKPEKIVIEHGYQGIQDHTGSGSIHVGEQRLEALRRFYQKPGEDEQAMTNRFFEEAVVHVAGSALHELPSHYDPKRFKILTGAVKGSIDQFTSIILDTGAVRPRVETVLFHENKLALRKDLVRKLRKLKEIELPPIEFDRAITETNVLLTSFQIDPIALDDLEPPKPQVAAKSKERRPEMLKYDDLKNVGFTDGQAGALLSKLRPILKSLDLKRPIDLTILEAAKEAFDTQDIDGAVKLITERLTDQTRASVPT